VSCQDQNKEHPGFLESSCTNIGVACLTVAAINKRLVCLKSECLAGWYHGSHVQKASVMVVTKQPSTC